MNFQLKGGGDMSSLKKHTKMNKTCSFYKKKVMSKFFISGVDSTSNEITIF